MATREVNQRQRAILAWIAEGCPERAWPDESHKHSARALATRGLVRVLRSNGRWTATLTDDGKYFHEHGEYPEGHPFAPKAPQPDSPNVVQAAVRRSKPHAPDPEPANEWPIDSPARLKRREKGVLADAPEDPPAHPWHDRVLISVKEAAWLLSVSEGMIREAARMGDIDRVFIGAGTTPYRIVHDSLLAWVNTLPTEPVRSRW